MPKNANQVGLAFGSILAIIHAVWAILVATNAAQTIIDFIFKLHFIDSPYIVNAFNLATAIGLVILVFVYGYIIGWILAKIWNKVLK